MYFTDVCLLYAPSQIALAAILHAASKVQENLDSYVTETLFGIDGQHRLADLIEAVRSKYTTLVRYRICNFLFFRNSINGKIS